MSPRFRPLLCLFPLLFAVAVHAADDNRAKKNYAVGTVTLNDGQPLPDVVDDVQVWIYGVSEAAEKVSYTPAVKNGAYKQKLVPGQYAFNPGRIKVNFNGTLFTFPLDPVGKLWNKSQDAEDGIVQDWIWHSHGLGNTYGDKPNPNNATHWRGMSVGMGFQTWRSDLKKAPEVPPAGTKLIFHLKPLSRGVDGSEVAPSTIERDWRPKDLTPNDDLNDLLPANYEISGEARYPDGTTHRLVFQGRGDYPNFKPAVSAPLETDSGTNGMWKQLIGWAVE